MGQLTIARQSGSLEVGNPVPAVRCSNVSCAFGSLAVLHDVSLMVLEGELVVLFGENGAGKTTLLRVIARLQRPSHGAVALGGVQTPDPAFIAAFVGMVGHQTGLYMDDTASENLRLFAQLHRLPNPDARVADLLALVGLERMAHVRIRALSRGMTQRLALARALLHDPPLLLLDEPDSGLDSTALADLPSLLRQPCGDGKPRTIIMTTHRVDWGRSLADRCFLLTHGKLTFNDQKPLERHVTSRTPIAPAKSNVALFRQVLALLRHDLVLEWRTRESIVPMAAFGLLAMLIFSFAFDVAARNPAPLVSGILWTAILFASMVGMGRAFAAERERGLLEALLLTPVSGSALFLAKAGSIVALTASLEVVLLGAASIFFNINVLNLQLLWTITLGTLGLALTGTLFAALSASTRARDVLLPLLLLPSLTPLVLAVVQASMQAIGDPNLLQGPPWLGLAAAYDVLFFVASVTLFDYVVRD